MPRARRSEVREGKPKFTDHQRERLETAWSRHSIRLHLDNQINRSENAEDTTQWWLSRGARSTQKRKRPPRREEITTRSVGADDEHLVAVVLGTRQAWSSTEVNESRSRS